MSEGQNDCERLQALLPAYSIGALSEAESREVELLLTRCPDAAADARAYARIARAMHSVAPTQTPPAALRDQVMKEAALASAFMVQSRAPTALPPPKRAESLQSATPKTRRPTGWIAALAAAAAVFLLTNVYWIAQVDSMRRDAEAREALLAQIAAPDARYVDLMSTDGDRAYGRVAWMPGGSAAVLRGEGLPPLPPDRTYQLWLIGANGVPVSAGVFQSDADGEALLIFQPTAPLNEIAAIGISTEPAGGSPAPTTDPMAVGVV
jgi:anti-sigma-K factor RskA